MNISSWQHPFVNIFKHFDIRSSKKCLKQGDISTVMDRDLKSTVYRIRGLIPANNYIQFPPPLSNPNLGLTGHLLYILFRPIYDKYFCIHVDILTHEQHLIRISLSNLYREFKITQTSIQFPYMTTGTDIHWSVLCLDLQSILLTYMTNQHYHMIKSFQLCGNMFVKNCFSSQLLYEPGVDNDTAKRTGLIRAGIHSLPRELSYPMDKSVSWHDKYDFIMFPNSSSLMGKNQNEPFDKVGSVRLPTPRKINSNKQNTNQSDDDDDDEQVLLTAQTTLVNGQTSRSMTDLAHITQRSVSSDDNQLNWRTYNNPTDHFPSLPNITDSSSSQLSHNNHNDGIHLFVNPKCISSIPDDCDYDLALTTNRLPQSRLSTLLPDPILRLRTVIGLGNDCPNLLWTQDGNYILYPSNAVVVQMHVETQQQCFFIGHTDRISVIAFNSHSSLLATIQTGSNAILRLWKFETRRCICAVRVPNTCNLYALDFGIEASSSSIVVVGHDEQSRTVVCVYKTSNAHKGSIELLSRAIAEGSITHIRFVPYDLTKFISIGLDNIHFWYIKNENDLKSISVSVNDQFEYTDLQFEYLSNHKLNESIVYISTKTGYIIELLYDERRVIRIHRLFDKLTTTKNSSMNICVFACTNNFCITGSNDGYIRVWSIDFSQVYIQAKYDQAICGLIPSYDQTRVLISTISGSLNMLNLVNKVHLNLMSGHTKFVTDIDYDDTRKQILSVADDGTIRIWCFSTGKQLSEFSSERDIPLVVAYTPSRQIFACGFNNGTIKIFDLNTSRILFEIKHHSTSITGLQYSHNGSCLLSSDEEGNLCLSDANVNYKLQRTSDNALIISRKGPTSLSISPDGKHTVYVGPTEFIVTIIETDNLNQTLRIDISSCTFLTNDRRSITSTDSALFARFTPNRQLLVATTNFKLLKFDSYTGKLLNIIESIHKHSIDSLALSSDSQYLITGGDNMLKFWDANMELDINFQNFIGHSGQVRKIFFTDDNMHVVSIGESIFIWDVLAWTKPRLTMPNNAQCIAPPQSVMTKILEDVPIRLNSQSINSSKMNQTIPISVEEKKNINKKLLTKQIDHANSSSPSSIRRHFIPRTNHSYLAKKRYVAPTNQESLKLKSIIGYNGNARDNLVWHPPSGFFAYTVGCNVIVENLTNTHQTILTGQYKSEVFTLKYLFSPTGHTEEISTLALSNNATVMASAQCSIGLNKDDLQTKIIIWNVKTLEQILSFHQSVHAIQSMAFSKDDCFLITIGNYEKPMLILWSTTNYTNLIHWQDEDSSSYLNCLAWNPINTNEFCLGSSNGTIHFCTINEEANRLQVINRQVNESCDITACVYLTSIINLVLCATNSGVITCWNSHLCLCIFHWKGDLNEICYMTTIKHKLLTGSSTGCLKLWNIENLQTNLSQLNLVDSNYGLTIQDEFQLDDGIISASFDDTFDMGIVGTSCGSLWYICWSTDRSKTRLVASHNDRITGLISIEDTHIITSSLDGTIRIFQLEDRNEILRFNINGSQVTCLTSWENSSVPAKNSTSPMKDIKSSIVAGYNDGTLRIFNISHNKMILEFQPHSSSITAVNVPLNSIISLSGASDGSIAISDLIQGLLLRVLNEHYGPAPICMIDSKILIENNSYMWLITSHDRRVSLWKSNKSFDSYQLIDWLTFSRTTYGINNWQSTPPSLACFIETNLLIYTGYGIDKCLQIYNIDTKQIVRKILLNQWCSSFDLSNIKKKNRLIAIGTNDRLVELKDYTQETFQDFIGNSDRISNIKFNKSNHLLITTSSNEIFVWKLVSK